MALTSNRKTAFDVEDNAIARAKSRKKKPPRCDVELYKLNVALDKRVKAPVKKAALDADTSLQALIQGLIVDHLVAEGYLDEKLGAEILGEERTWHR